MSDESLSFSTGLPTLFGSLLSLRQEDLTGPPVFWWGGEERAPPLSPERNAEGRGQRTTYHHQQKEEGF